MSRVGRIGTGADDSEKSLEVGGALRLRLEAKDSPSTGSGVEVGGALRLRLEAVTG